MVEKKVGNSYALTLIYLREPFLKLELRENTLIYIISQLTRI